MFRRKYSEAWGRYKKQGQGSDEIKNNGTNNAIHGKKKRRETPRKKLRF